jgi:hypothetical protein
MYIFMYVCVWVYMYICSFKFFTVHCIIYLILYSRYFCLKHQSIMILWVANFCKYYSSYNNKICASPRVLEDAVLKMIFNSHQKISCLRRRVKIDTSSFTKLLWFHWSKKLQIHYFLSIKYRGNLLFANLHQCKLTRGKSISSAESV